jgi:hypothetical protein
VNRRILLETIAWNPDRCVIDPAADDSVAFRGDAVDAPTLCCGNCEAELVIGVDRSTLTNMTIVCKRCGALNDTRARGI